MPSYIVKADPDQDWYCLWSTIVDAPTRWGARSELEAQVWDPREVAPERFDRADDNGTSAMWPDWPKERQPFAWTAAEFVLMEAGPDDPEGQEGDGYWLLQRANLRAFCEALDADRDTTDLCRWERYDTPDPADHGTAERGEG